MLEKQFYASHVRPFILKYGEVFRIENAMGSGMPDLMYMGNKKTGFIETKVVHNGKIYFERFQLPWYNRYLKHGADKSLWVIATDTVNIWLLDPKELLNAYRSVEKDWVVISSQVCDLVSTESHELKERVVWHDFFRRHVF